MITISKNSDLIIRPNLRIVSRTSSDKDKNSTLIENIGIVHLLKKNKDSTLIEIMIGQIET